MQPVQGSSRGNPAPASKRRGMATRIVRLAGGAALTVGLLSLGGLQPVAAQDDDTIVLTAGGSTLTVTPGTADAVSAVAEAHAGPGYAETIAAGARAIAISDCGAMTEASAARAIARPDEGALTEAEGGAVLSDDGGSDAEAFAEQLAAEILAENEALQMIEGGEGGANDPVRAVALNQDEGREILPVTPELCPDEDRKIEPPAKEEPAPEYVPEEVVVVETPSTGSGSGLTALSSLFGAGAAAAAFGAVALRTRREPGELETIAIGSDRIA